jgi:hypothetical protein
LEAPVNAFQYHEFRASRKPEDLVTVYKTPAHNALLLLLFPLIKCSKSGWAFHSQQRDRLQRCNMTKAEVIRALLRENPEGKPLAMAKIASKKLGNPVKPSDVSNYKSLMKKNGELNGKPQPATIIPTAPSPAAKPAVVGRETMTVTETVELVKELVGQLGKDELKKLVDVV